MSQSTKKIDIPILIAVIIGIVAVIALGCYLVKTVYIPANTHKITSQEEVAINIMYDFFERGIQERQMPTIEQVQLNRVFLDKENNNNTKKIKKLSIDYKIKMPKNLTILATINTSDQNVFNLDTAFGRRWEYLHVTDNFLTENHIALTDEAQKFENDNIKGFNIQWSEFRNAINNAILDSDNIWNKEDKRLGKFYISGDMLCDKDDSSFLEESYENNKIRASFLNKVLRYLWFDVFKSDHSELIDDDNINSFEQLVDKLKKSSDALNTALKPLKNNEENN